MKPSYYGKPPENFAPSPTRGPSVYACTLPLPMFEGQYNARKIPAEEAAKLIRDACDGNRFTTMVHAGTTARLLTEISGRIIRRVEKPRLPKPVNGDRLICVRLAQDIQREAGTQPLGILDVEFLLVEYSSP